MKLKKRTIIILLVIIILVVVWYIHNKNKKVKLEAEQEAKMAYSVVTWDIKTEVKVSATAKLANEQNLSFWKQWKITNVFVSVWDEVKEWDILAELSMDDFQNNIETAKLEVKNAQLSLEKLLNNDTSLLESQISNQISEANSNYKLELEQKKILKKQLEAIMKQKEDELDQFLRDYRLSEKNLEIAKSWLEVNTNIENEQTEDTLLVRIQTINSIIDSLNFSLWDMKYIVESVDEIFWVSSKFKNKNDQYDIYLWAKNTNLKNLTKSNISKSYNFINKYQFEVEKIDSQMSDNDIYNIIQSFYWESKILVELCDNALDTIDMSIESLGNLSSSDIEWFKTTLTTSRASSLSVRTNLENLSTSILSLLSGSSTEEQSEISLHQKQLDYEKQELLLLNKKDNILFLNKNIDNLKLDHANQLNRKTTQLDNILDNIGLLEKELQDVIDWPDSYDINQLKNTISQAELRLEKALDQKDDYQITAEFDWRVRSVDIIVWEQYELDDRKFIVVENPNLIELELEVNQIDIVKIKEDNPVVITFDAFPHNPIDAKITSRNVNPEANWRWWIFYKVNIILEKQDLEILAGMSALVTVTTDSAKNVLLIPSLALVQKSNKQFVYIKDWETYKLHEIKTGIVNNFNAEVIEGLKEWDIIKSSVLNEQALMDMWIDDWSDTPFGK